MKIKTSQLKTIARTHLAGRYGTLIMAYIITRIICNIPSLIISSTINTTSLIGGILDFCVSLIVVFITAIFVVGHNYICLSMARTATLIPTSHMWFGFKNKADDTIRVYFQYVIRVFAVFVPLFVALYFFSMDTANITLLLIVLATGILGLAAYVCIWLDYALILFLLVDWSNQKASDILKESKRLMKGNKKRFCSLYASIFGLYVLAFLSMGIGILWVYPYTRMMLTEFYLDVTGQIRIFDSKTANGFNPYDREIHTEDPNYYKEIY